MKRFYILHCELIKWFKDDELLRLESNKGVFTILDYSVSFIHFDNGFLKSKLFLKCKWNIVILEQLLSELSW